MEQVNKGLWHWNDQLKNLKSYEKFSWDYCDKSLYKKCIYKEVFDKEIGNKVSDICKNNNLLIYTFLVSTLKITLSKYMGKNDIVIGIPCYSNQNMRGNVHINKLLPLVSSIDNEMTYLEYMGAIKAKVLENYKNQAYLKSKILVQNGLPNDVMELVPISICMRGLNENTDINYICESSKNELSFLLDPMEDKSIDIRITYNSNKITEDTVKALYQSYETALRDILNNYNKKIKDIKILSERDIKKILYEFNDTKADYPKDKTIHELFEEQVEKTPDNIAVVFEDKKLTYRELNERSNSLARVLRDKGVKADSIVGIMVERSLEMIVGIMGVLKAGGAYLPIDPNYPKERIDYMLKDSDSKILLSKNDLIGTVEFEGYIVDLYDETLYDKNYGNLGKINNSTNLAYIIYTSGTTGNPKGAMIEHRSLVNRLNWMQKKYTISEKDTILQKTTYTFDVSVWEILWWSLVGAKVCMLSPNAEKDPMKIIETIDKYEVTTMHFVPSMLDVFLYCVEENRNNLNLATLRQVFSSGEALNFKQVSKFYKEFEKGKKLINLYGPTEATIDVSYFDCVNDGKRIIPIGKPIDNTQLYILKNNELVPIGVAGELYIAGHGLARGYVNKSELTAEKFVDNPFEPGTKMYKTGDLARWLPDGNIEFLGRIDNQVKIRGFRIELGEIENRLLQHESIKEVAVLVKENKDSEKYISAYIVSEHALEKLNLKSYLKETLPEYMVPAYFVQLEKMPLTTNGKLDRRALPEPNLDIALTEYESPRNEVEETLAKIWSDVLGIEKVGINDNFFDLGGHSIKMINLVSKINTKFNVNFEIKDLYVASTIKLQSELIESFQQVKIENIKVINEKLIELYGNECRLIQYITENREVIVLYSNNDFNEVINMMKDQNWNDFLPNYVKKYSCNISKLDETQFISEKNLEEHLNLEKIIINELSNYENVVNKELVVQSNNICRNRIISKHDLSYLIKHKCEFAHEKINRPMMYFDIELNDGISEEEIEQAIIRISNEQSIFRTVIDKEGDEYKFIEYDCVDSCNLTILDITKYDYESKKSIAFNIFNAMKKNFENNEYLNSLLYNFTILKIDHKSYIMIIYIDHLISDIYTPIIIKKYFTNRDKDKVINAMQFSNYIKEISMKQTKEKLEVLKESKLFVEFKEVTSKFFRKYTMFSNGEPIIYSKPFTIKYKFKSQQSSQIDISNPYKIIQILSLNILSNIFEIDDIPMRIFVNNRRWGELSYYDTIGDFTDSILCVFSKSNNSYFDCYEEYLNFQKYFLDNKISLKDFSFDYDWAKYVFTDVPFTLSFTGDYSEYEDKDTVNGIKNYMRIPYPILAHSINNESVRLIFYNGIKESKLNAIENILNKFGGEYEFNYI